MADFDSDGKLDLAVGGGGDNDVQILAGNGDGTHVRAAVDVPAVGDVAVFLVGDYDG